MDISIGEPEVGAGYAELCHFWVESALHSLDAVTTVVYSLEYIFFFFFAPLNYQALQLQCKQNSVTSQCKNLLFFELRSPITAGLVGLFESQPENSPFLHSLDSMLAEDIGTCSTSHCSLIHIYVSSPPILFL